MHRLLLSLSALVAAPLACSSPGTTTPNEPTDHGSQSSNPKSTVSDVVERSGREQLTRFKSTKDLKQFLDRVHPPSRRDYASAGSPLADSAAGEVAAAEYAPSPEPAPSMSAPATASAPEAKSADKEDESITNTQEVGVDEGGIVKTHGDHLVVLRRGRLFTVDIGRKAPRPLSVVSVNPEQGHDAWYDEMLIHDDTIVVVGYSYQASATEIGLFDIDRAGRLTHRDTFFMRSNDYYSSRNYASRLLGQQLVFYMPYALPYAFNALNPDLPGIMPWNQNQQRFDDWHTIIDATEIYRPIQSADSPVLHTVVTCDLGRKDVHCNAQGIIGPEGRSFYVSSSAVYVWVHGGHDAPSAEGKEPPAVVYRFPLVGGDPGALRVWGAPVDQFSFKESDDGFLNVLVMASSPGEQMWGAEFAGEDVAMMRVPTTTMADGVNTVTTRAYVDLPEPKGNGYTFQNRFVGRHLLYGRGSSWGEGAAGDASLHVFPIEGRSDPAELVLPHAIDRIEPMGDAAVVVGTDGRDLHFASIDLQRQPNVAGEFLQSNASQGETRSHGFFFKPEGPGDGTLGLPLRRSGAAGYEQLENGSAEVLFLHVEDLNFERLGALSSDPRTPQDDRCEVSCVDWYGNARPIFYRGRVFALLGYELVEGRIDRAAIHEVGRTNMLSLLGQGSEQGVIWKDL